MMVVSILTLLSDFGLSDTYVGEMKGAIAKINPRLTVIDLTHQIPPQNLAAARFCLTKAYPHFPNGTVHVAVVDPGVGSQRRAIALQLQSAYLVGPDNGLFSDILAQEEAIAAVELTQAQYWHVSTPSTTFHGRDIFAPVGAHLASGVALAEVGRAIALESLVKLPTPQPTKTAKEIEGVIQYIDSFGNLVTNILGSEVQGKNWGVELKGQKIVGDRTYANCPVGSAIALVGSHGYIEIAINCGSAQSQLQLNWGDTIQVMIE